jgi:putative membrane protein
MVSTILLAADRWGNDGHWHGFPFGLLLFAGLIAFVISRRRRHFGGWPHVGASAGPAQRILDERYARGELDAEEYRVRSTVLGERRAAQHRNRRGGTPG